MYPMIGNAAKVVRTIAKNAGIAKIPARSGWHWTSTSKAIESPAPPPNDTTYTAPLFLKALTTKLGNLSRFTKHAIPHTLPIHPFKKTYHTQTDRIPLLVGNLYNILRDEAQSVGTSIPETLNLLSCPEKALPITTKYVHDLVDRLKASIPKPDISAKHRTTNPVRDIAQGLFQSQNDQPRPIDRNEMLSYLTRELLLSPGKTELGSLIGVPKQGSSLKEKNPELYCMMQQMADTDENLIKLLKKFQESTEDVKELFKQKEMAVLVANAPHPNPYAERFLDLYTQLTDAGLKLTPAFFGTVDQGYLKLNKGNMSIQLECGQYAETMASMLKQNPNMTFDLYLSGAAAPVYDEVDEYSILHERTLDYVQYLVQHLEDNGITLLPEQLNIIAGDTHGQANSQNITDLHHLLKENGFKLARYHNHLNPFATEDNDIEQDWIRIIHNQLRCMELGIATDHTAGTGQGNPAKGDTLRKNANIPPTLPTLLAFLSDHISIDGTDTIEQKKRALILDLFRTHTIPRTPCQHDLFLTEMGPKLLREAIETYPTIT